MTTTTDQPSNPRHPKEFPVTPGTPVLTQDGAHLGTVAEVLPEHFSVDPEGRGDSYWLAKSSLAEPNESAASLNFDEADLDLHRMEEPVAQAASPVLDASADAFDSREDLERTRAQMVAGQGEPVRENAGR